MKFNQVTWYSKILALAFFVALPFLGFWLGVKYQEAINPNLEVVPSNLTTENQSGSGAKPTPGKIVKQTTNPSITVTYDNGIYYYIGTIQFSETCGSITAKASVTRTDPAVVNIFLTTHRPEGVMCGQAFTNKPFSGQIAASEGATINVYLNDQLVK